MSNIFVLLSLLALIALILGIIKPSLFVSLNVKSRKNVLAVFGGLVIIFLILTGLTSPKTNNDSNTQSITPAVTKSMLYSHAKIASSPTPVTNQSTISLVGFGATISDWNKNHNADKRFNKNSTYNPSPDLGDSTRFNDEYYGMNWSDGSNNDSRATNYQMRLGNNQTQTTAQFTVMKEFPLDVSVVWQKSNTSDQTNECYQMEVQSKIVGSILTDPKIGDPKGYVFLEFFTDPAPNPNDNSYYDPQNVNGALLQLGSYATANDAPAC